MNTKDYIGNGRQVKDLDIVKVTISMDEAEAFIHEYNGKKYLSFQVAKLKEPNQFGQSHSAYIFKPEAAPEQPQNSKPKRRRKRTTKPKSKA